MKTLYYGNRLREVPIIILKSNEATVDLHKHDFFEFVYVVSGSAEHIFENKTVTVSQGDYFLINLGSAHEYRRLKNVQDFSVINILFLPRFIDESLRSAGSFREIVDNYMVRYGYNPLGELPTQKIFHDDNGTVERLAESAFVEYREKKDGYTDILRNLLLSLIIHLVRGEASHALPGTDATVRQIKEYVSAHYMHPLRLSELCDRMSFSLSYISSLFREKTGMTFRQYLLRVRMEKACFFLRSSDMTVGRIAAAVGYADPAFFHKVFRREIGCTPEQYRETGDAMRDAQGETS